MQLASKHILSLKMSQLNLPLTMPLNLSVLNPINALVNVYISLILIYLNIQIIFCAYLFITLILTDYKLQIIFSAHQTSVFNFLADIFQLKCFQHSSPNISLNYIQARSLRIYRTSGFVSYSLKIFGSHVIISKLHSPPIVNVTRCSVKSKELLTDCL